MSRSACLAVAIAVVGLVPCAAAQKPDGGQQFSASVLDLSKSSQRIMVPRNRSVAVETSVAITRADVVAPNVANVQMISPTRMLITGQSFRSTSVVLTGSDDEQYVFEATVELDLESLNRSIRNIDPLGTVTATSMFGNIVLTGSVTSTTRARRIVDLAQLFALSGSSGSRGSSRQGGSGGSMGRSGGATGAGSGGSSGMSGGSGGASGGRGGSSSRGARVQNHMDISGEQQVQLRCVVAEVTRAASRELGVNGFLAGQNVKDMFLVNQIAGINPVNIGAAAGASVVQDIPFFTDQSGLNLSPTTPLSIGFPRVQTQLFIKAMADNNLLKVLAEPILTAISGETATFLAGGEFPIPVPQGNQQVTIEFREFGIRLNFTPVVRGQGRIRLRVAPEVSELDFTTAIQIEGFVVPGLTSRSTETTVELGSGQTIAIAGLLSEQVRAIATRIPGVGDMPVLGSLFRSVNFQRSLTELVVLVTPEIVAPLDPHQKVKIPGDGMNYPSDYELFALGMLESPVVETQATNANGDAVLQSEPDEVSLHGPWGHAGVGSTR